MPDVVDCSLKQRVAEALAKDFGRGLARLDPAEMARLGLEVGDFVELVGERTAVARLMPTYSAFRGQGRVQLDEVSRENAGAVVGETITLCRAAVRSAERVVFSVPAESLASLDVRAVANLCDGLAIGVGDRVRLMLFGNRPLDLRVAETQPQGFVVFNDATRMDYECAGASSSLAEIPAERPLRYDDVGGLRQEVQRVREMIDLPLSAPVVFERLGIGAPKGLLLHGPPGCGKTLIARAVAEETRAAFLCVNGPEVIHKYYGESEAHLRDVFEEAARRAPSVIFIDEIDAIAPRRDHAAGNVEKRVVAQLLALMDGLAKRSNVVVIAATNLPDALDPALRRPGRFDREIAVPIPNRDGRREILAIHSKRMPLARGIDLDQLAAVTHGFVGADLEALCREAAMTSLRRTFPEMGRDVGTVSPSAIRRLEVRMDDFLAALREVEPSAIREVFVERPDVRWEDVGGLDDVKRQLIEAVDWPLKHADYFARVAVRPSKGILLAGLPGSGKTLLAKAVAAESRVNFISVKGPALLSKYVGESERAVREVFRKARQAAPCIVFFDEIDALVPARRSNDSDSRVVERVVGQFLAEMDGVEELNGVLVLGATNRPDLLDPALLRPGRFDLQIQIPLPDADGREAVFRIGLRNKPVEPDVSLAELAAWTEGFTGAEIQAICRQAALSAIRSALAGDADREREPSVSVTRAHLIQALDLVRAQHISGP